MKKSVALSALACAMLSFLPAQAQVLEETIPVELHEYMKDHYIVVFDNTVRPSLVDARSRQIVAAVAGERTRVYKTALRGFSAHMSAEQAERLAERFPEIA